MLNHVGRGSPAEQLAGLSPGSNATGRCGSRSRGRPSVMSDMLLRPGRLTPWTGSVLEPGAFTASCPAQALGWRGYDMATIPKVGERYKAKLITDDALDAAIAAYLADRRSQRCWRSTASASTWPRPPWRTSGRRRS